MSAVLKAQALTAIAHEIKLEWSKGLEHFKRVGEMLRGVKSKLDHGEFTAWVEANFEFSSCTARRYMRIADGRYPLTKTVTDDRFAVSTDKNGNRAETTSGTVSVQFPDGSVGTLPTTSTATYVRLPTPQVVTEEPPPPAGGVTPLRPVEKPKVCAGAMAALAADMRPFFAGVAQATAQRVPFKRMGAVAEDGTVPAGIPPANIVQQALNSLSNFLDGMTEAQREDYARRARLIFKRHGL